MPRPGFKCSTRRGTACTGEGGAGFVAQVLTNRHLFAEDGTETGRWLSGDNMGGFLRLMAGDSLHASGVCVLQQDHPIARLA